jgi:hypothetical protein
VAQPLGPGQVWDPAEQRLALAAASAEVELLLVPVAQHQGSELERRIRSWLRQGSELERRIRRWLHQGSELERHIRGWLGQLHQALLCWTEPAPECCHHLELVWHPE